MKLHVVDGTYELFRAYFAKRPSHASAKGQDVKATLGVMFSLLALLQEEKVTHVAAAFDNPIRSFRNELFDGYKTEAGVPQDLLDQFDLVERATRALGIVVWSMDRWEADDALATAAARWGDEVEQVRIMTPDKDLGQALRGQRVVQVDRMRRTEIDEEALWKKRGVRPASIPDFLALVGDDADGVPGLPGFGEKGASALLAAYGHIEDIPSRAADWRVPIRGADKLAATLAENRDRALLYRQLTTLVKDVPLKESLGDLEWKGVPRDAFQAMCQELAAKDLAARQLRWL